MLLVKLFRPGITRYLMIPGFQRGYENYHYDSKVLSKRGTPSKVPQTGVLSGRTLRCRGQLFEISDFIIKHRKRICCTFVHNKIAINSSLSRSDSLQCTIHYDSRVWRVHIFHFCRFQKENLVFKTTCTVVGAVSAEMLF